MQQATIYQQYKTQALETLTDGEIVIKLFEEASKQVSTSIFLLNRNDSVKAFNCIVKAQKIITSLDRSLDMKYSISIELHDMYSFLFHELSKAVVQKDVTLMKDLLGIIDELKVTFRQADRIARTKK